MGEREESAVSSPPRVKDEETHDVTSSHRKAEEERDTIVMKIQAGVTSPISPSHHQIQWMADENAFFFSRAQNKRSIGGSLCSSSHTGRRLASRSKPSFDLYFCPAV